MFGIILKLKASSIIVTTNCKHNSKADLAITMCVRDNTCFHDPPTLPGSRNIFSHENRRWGHNKEIGTISAFVNVLENPRRGGGYPPPPGSLRVNHSVDTPVTTTQIPFF